MTEHHAPHDHTARVAAHPAPAGIELDYMVGDAPATRSRSKLRRRLRHLRKVRELLLRDLGGFVLETHRAVTPAAPGAQDRLVERKLDRLAAVDAEIAELEQLLDDRRPAVIREPGIGGACLNCGELYGSSARFCWACGTAVAPGHGRRAVAPAPPTHFAQLSAPAAPAPQRSTDWIDSEAHPLGDQPTAIMHPSEPDPPTQVLPPDAPAPAPDQATEAFDATAEPFEPSPWIPPPAAPEPPAAEPIPPIRQTASFQAPAEPLPPPPGPSTVNLPVPPGLEPEPDPEPHPADALWNDPPGAPDRPPAVSPGDPLATRDKPDA